MVSVVSTTSVVFSCCSSRVVVYPTVVRRDRHPLVHSELISNNLLYVLCTLVLMGFNKFTVVIKRAHQKSAG